VRKRLETVFGKFSLLEVKIDTGRTHQIRVHLSSLAHAVVGDATYGAPKELRAKANTGKERRSTEAVLKLGRNFLHAEALELKHPRTGEALFFRREIPVELQEFLMQLQGM
jgi:23S rRNA pseudouridine1911/1915/1917 synthase